MANGIEGNLNHTLPASVGGKKRPLENVAALELLADCAAAEAVAAKDAKGVNLVQVNADLHFDIFLHDCQSPVLFRSDQKLVLACKVRDMLRTSVREAAEAATRKASEAAVSSPQGSTLLWSLLRQCLRQQGEALIDVQQCKSAAKGAYGEVCNVNTLFGMHQRSAAHVL